MYPKKIVDSEKFHVIYNAVDRGKFVWRPEIRKEVRQELELGPEQSLWDTRATSVTRKIMNS